MKTIRIVREIVQTQELIIKCDSIEEANEILQSNNLTFSKWTNTSEPEVKPLPEKTCIIIPHKITELLANDIVELYSYQELLDMGYVVNEKEDIIAFQNYDFPVRYFNIYEPNKKYEVSIIYEDKDFSIKDSVIIFPNEMIKKIYNG